jgi:hypothetical protein
MAKHPNYPGVSSKTDRHGKIRWRFRRTGSPDVMLPGQPGSAEFEAAYFAAVEGRPAKPTATATIIRLPNGALPKTFNAAYHELKNSAEWSRLLPKTMRQYADNIERKILTQPVKPGGKDRWGDAPVGDCRRSDVKALLKRWGEAEGEFTERMVLLVLRKLIMAAIEAEWIVTDPTYGLKRAQPDNSGHRTWSQTQMDQFEAHWPIGSVPRTAYADARARTGGARPRAQSVRRHQQPI